MIDRVAIFVRCPPRRHDGARGRVIAAFAAVYVIWGSTYLAIRYAVESMPPLLMVGSRFALSGTILYALVARARRRETDRRRVADRVGHRVSSDLHRQRIGGLGRATRAVGIGRAARGRRPAMDGAARLDSSRRDAAARTGGRGRDRRPGGSRGARRSRLLLGEMAASMRSARACSWRRRWAGRSARSTTDTAPDPSPHRCRRHCR